MSDPRITFASSVTSGAVEELERRLRDTELLIVVSPEACTSLSGQLLVWQLATLSARYLDVVTVVADEFTLGHPKNPFVGSRFVRVLRSALSEIRPVSGPPRHPQTTIRVVVGDDSGAEGNLYVGCGRWVARLSCESPQKVIPTETTIGALAAGALGAAEVFKFLFGDLLRGGVRLQKGIKDGYTLSLLNYNDAADDPELPPAPIDAVLFGAGSIGCAFLLALESAPQVHGAITVVDNGHFDERNPYKYQLLDWASATANLRKAPWAQSHLTRFAGPRVRALAYRGTAKEFVASLQHDYRLPLVVSAVDTPDARLEIQDALPEWIANAGVEGTCAEVSVHGFGTGPCLACLALQTELRAWDAKPIAEAVGLPAERVHELIGGNGPLTRGDVERMKSAARLRPALLGELDSFVGQPVLSLYNRVPYSEASLATPKGEVRVTTAFVSAFAGVLLFAEVAKKAAGLSSSAVANSYRQDLIGVPAHGTFKYERDMTGACACASNFRQAVYREKYGRFPS